MKTKFKRIWLVVIMGCAIHACYQTSSFAITVTQNMTASVGVNPIFSIEVSPTSLNFGSASPGTRTPDRELVLTCTSNSNNRWYLKLSNTSDLTSGSFTIPNAYFIWSGWSEGTGTWYPGTGEMSTIPFTFYACGTGEFITFTPVRVHLVFNVDIPANQPGGTYLTTLIVTMTE